MKKSNNYKIIAVVGPTASGKSRLAIQLAKEFNGEIINADSRQIYKHMNIGTAKDPDDNPNDECYIVAGIRHHLIDFIDPGESFSVAQFQKAAKKKVKDITKRGKVPFLVGGTGLWVDAVCKRYEFTESGQNLKLREDLEQKSIEELYLQLEELNPSKANALNESDRKNQRRLIRAIEKERTPLPSLVRGVNHPSNKGDREGLNIIPLYLSPKITFEELEQRIYSRVEEMFEQGLLEENKELLEIGYTYDLPSMSGIGYKEFEDYFKTPPTNNGGSSPTLEEVKEEIKLRTRQYAKRQVTWFKKNEEIRYVDLEEARKQVSKFLR